MDSTYFIYYALKLKAEGLLDTRSYSLLKDVSENIFKEGEKNPRKTSYVLPGTGCFFPVNFKCLQTLDSEESREMHDRLVLDAQLKLIQPSQL